jgi:hypothetical protein
MEVRGPEGTCAWQGCANAFKGELPHDWIRLCAYWSARPETEKMLVDVVMSPFCKLAPFFAVNTQQNLRECSNRQIATGWPFRPRADPEKVRPDDLLQCIDGHGDELVPRRLRL